MRLPAAAAIPAAAAVAWAALLQAHKVEAEDLNNIKKNCSAENQTLDFREFGFGLFENCKRREMLVCKKRNRNDKIAAKNYEK